jgi:hypothetical protein
MRLSLFPASAGIHGAGEVPEDNMDNVLTLAWKMVSTNDRDNPHCQDSSGFA